MTSEQHKQLAAQHEVRLREGIARDRAWLAAAPDRPRFKAIDEALAEQEQRVQETARQLATNELPPAA